MTAVTPATLFADLVIVAAALYALLGAARETIDRLLSLAAHYGVPDVLVGMTVLAVGTSLPEIGSHVVASVGILAGTLEYRIASAVVLGGNTGASTTQQLLLTGLLLVGYGGFEFTGAFLRRYYAPMVAAMLATLAVVLDGTVSRIDGVILLTGYVAYVAYGVRTRERSVGNTVQASASVRRDAVVAAVSLALVLASTTVLLSVIERVVLALRLGGSTVGVLTLGLASALPELTAVAESIRRRTPDIAMGTLVGSNVVNPLVGIGLGGALSTYYVPPVVLSWDLPFKVVAAVAIAGYAVTAGDGRLSRTDGVSLVVAYFAFVAGRLLLFPGQ